MKSPVPLEQDKLRNARVSRVVAETPDARSFELDVDGMPWEHRAGQHVQVAVEIGERIYERIFSLSNCPAHEPPRITIKRRAAGIVSPQRPSNVSICDYYMIALLKNNTAENQYTLLTLLVNTAVIDAAVTMISTTVQAVLKAGQAAS